MLENIVARGAEILCAASAMGLRARLDGSEEITGAGSRCVLCELLLMLDGNDDTDGMDDVVVELVELVAGMK